jgi:hypothetical protein
MKLFSQYLNESVRNYNYSIKLAFKPNDDVLNKIEKSLAKYQLVDIKAPQSKPITRVDKDFPGINSPEVYTIDISTAYPASSNMVRYTIASIGLELQDVAVVSTDHEASVDAEENLIDTNDAEGLALLDREEPKQDNKKISEENYGDAYNEKLVKNSIGSTDQIIPKELKKIKGETTNDLPTGTKSAMGSVKPKIPTVKSFAR